MQLKLVAPCFSWNFLQGANKSNICFLLDGDAINESDTPDGLEMENGDVMHLAAEASCVALCGGAMISPFLVHY